MNDAAEAGRPLSSTPSDPWYAWGLLSGAAVAALVMSSLWDFVSSYRLRGDDFAVVLNSCPPYFGIRDWATWFTSGYSDYFSNYHGWPSIGSDFARPAVNAAFYLEHWLTPLAGDSAFLLVSYLAVFASAAMMTGVLRRSTNTPLGVAVALSVAVGLSPVWHGALFFAGLATNALALSLFVASLLVLDPARGVPRGWSLTVCILLQVLAVASHETAIVAPFVSVALLFALAPRSPRLLQLLPFSVPLIYLVTQRAILGSASAMYPFRSVGLLSIVKKLVAPAVGPLIPSNLPVWIVSRATPPPEEILAIALAGIAGLAVLGVFIAGFNSHSRSRSLAMIVAVVVAFVPAVLVGAETRFRGIGLVVALVALCFFAQGLSWKRYPRVVVSLVVIANVLLFYAGVVTVSASFERDVRAAGQFFDATRAAIANGSPRTVVLVDDNVGQYGSLAMLRVAAWPNTSTRLIAVNSYEGEPSQSASSSVSVTNGVLHVRVALGSGQEVRFPGAVPDFTRPANGLRYAGIPAGRSPLLGSFEATGFVSAGPTLAVGVDTRTGLPFQRLLF